MRKNPSFKNLKKYKRSPNFSLQKKDRLGKRNNVKKGNTKQKDPFTSFFLFLIKRLIINVITQTFLV